MRHTGRPVLAQSKHRCAKNVMQTLSEHYITFLRNFFRKVNYGKRFATMWTTERCWLIWLGPQHSVSSRKRKTELKLWGDMLIFADHLRRKTRCSGLTPLLEKPLRTFSKAKEERVKWITLSRCFADTEWFLFQNNNNGLTLVSSAAWRAVGTCSVATH